MISVVICTHNRASYLRRALMSVLAQDPPATAHEIVVIDNGSTDGTRAVVEESGSRVRYVFEPKLGLSNARNTGWREAQGSHVAYLDDDAVAEPGWLRALAEAFSTVRPEPACVGGRVSPLWEAERPSWLGDRLLPCLTVADWTDTPHAVTDLTKEWLVGANIAFSRSVLERLGGFPAALGRVGGRLLSGEETFLQSRILLEGLTCWYEPRAAVGHAVPAARLDPRWFRQRLFSQGVSDAVMRRLEAKAGQESTLLLALRQFRWLLKGGFGIPGYLQDARDPDAFGEHCGQLWRLGYVAGLLRLV